jgi:hypothetical protein
MSRRSNGYTTVRQEKLNKRKSGSNPSTGKKAIYFTTGGRGTKMDQGERSGGNSFWNAGRCKPSLRYAS